VTSRLNPYLQFENNARAAMEFYQSVLGGELVISTFGEAGAAGEPYADGVMHAILETPKGFTLMASDTPPGMEFRPGSTVSVSLSGDDIADLTSYWEKLSAGATITVPFAKQMWGDTFGACIDQFGTSWMVNVTQA
jgi:PhnB protein